MCCYLLIVSIQVGQVRGKEHISNTGKCHRTHSLSLSLSLSLSSQVRGKEHIIIRGKWVFITNVKGKKIS
jgi:hypothetical protein